MGMKRFVVIVTREYEIVLDVDERIEPDDGWRKTFYPYWELDEMAEHIAYNLIRSGRNSFVEGVGGEGELQRDGTGGFIVESIDDDLEWEVRSVEEEENP